MIPEVRVEVPPIAPNAADEYRSVPQVSDEELATLDEHEDDPPEFDRSLVPDGPVGDYFFSGRTGRGLTNEEYDTLRDRMREHGGWPLDHLEDDAS